MSLFKLFLLAVTVFNLAAPSLIGQQYSSSQVKRSEGTVPGANPGVSYFWNSTGTSQQCTSLLPENLQASLVQFDPLFVRRYNDKPSPSQTTWGIGALYLGYPEGTYGFDFLYTSVTPNITATWVDTGADITNVWTAVRKDAVDMWSHKTTFQWIWYDINKIVDGVSNHAGQFRLHIQTPTFVKGCDTRCGGGCHPQNCNC